MGTQDLYVFLKRFRDERDMRRAFCVYLSGVSGPPDILAAIANFAFGHGHEIDVRDLLALDTALDASAARGALHVTTALHVFAHDYLLGCNDPTKYCALGYYDPDGRKLWCAH